MRKVRDYDAELKSLNDKARALKSQKIQQLGELVTATGAGGLDIKLLAGVLLAALESSDDSAKEAWRAKGAAFFQQRARKAVPRPRLNEPGDGSDNRGGATS